MMDERKQMIEAAREFFCGPRSERSVTFLPDIVDFVETQLAAANEKANGLVQALEKYADKANWDDDDGRYGVAFVFRGELKEYLDGYDLAQAALNEYTKQK